MRSELPWPAQVRVVSAPQGSPLSWPASSMDMEIGLDFIDTPLFFEDELDFGLDGRVPFQLTLTDGHLNISVAQLPLSPDLQIPNLSQDYVASLAGTFEVQGITSVIDDSTPFFGSNVRVTGKDYEVDLNALEAVLHLAIQNTGTFVGPVYTGLLNGKTLEIFVSFSTSGSLGREISAMTGVFDTDGDGFVDLIDNCPTVSNPNQTDTDADGIGDACNDADDLDGDEWSDALDNCVNDPNPGQEDVDFDLIGDICDPFPNDPDNEQAQCDADLTTCSTDFSICDSDLTTCSADLGTAQADLTQCAADEAVLLQSLDDCQTGPPFVGDVNRDGEVNLLDAVLLRRQLAGLPIEPPRPAVTALKLRSTPTRNGVNMPRLRLGCHIGTYRWY
jgi:hypothetical protein